MNPSFVELLLLGIGSLMVSKVMNTIVTLSPYVAVKKKMYFSQFWRLGSLISRHWKLSGASYCLPLSAVVSLERGDRGGEWVPREASCIGAFVGRSPS